MAHVRNQKDVASTALPGGARRQALIDARLVADTKCRFDRVVLDASSAWDITVVDRDVLWFQVVAGSAEVTIAGTPRRLAELDACFLPPGISGQLTAGQGAELIVLAIPAADQLDPTLGSLEVEPRFVDLSAEPLLQSAHDERQRIYVASQTLFGTTAFAGEIVIFPPGVISSNHHHVGAEHFQYILRGSGTLFLNEQPQRIAAGDLIYKYDFERHYVQNDDDRELLFVEFFAPGEWETEWADPELECTWTPTGQNLQGTNPSRKIAAHTSDGTIYEDV